MLRDGKAAVYRKYPFTVIVKAPEESAAPSPLRLKIDPGSRVTGLAIVNDAKAEIVWAGELTHKGTQIKAALDKRRQLRRGRRSRNLRYRPARFDNRGRGHCHGCGRNPAKNKDLCRPCAAKPRAERGPVLAARRLPPSLMSRVHNTETWVKRLRAAFPITAISVERVRFDTQLMENPDISGVEYQQGELAGYEVREYLLEKWGRQCAYCGKGNVPLEIEHIIPKSRNGSNRVSNLTIACEPCNKKKDKLTAEEFGHPKVQVQARLPLRDAAMMNATRYCIVDMLRETGLPVETGTGGRTKYQRTRGGFPKSHWADAAFVGESTPTRLRMGRGSVLEIRARSFGKVGRRQVIWVDASGFPRKDRGPKAGVRFFGWQTGDMVRDAAGQVGRLSVRASGSFLFTPRGGGKASTLNRKNIAALVSRCGSFEYSHERLEMVAAHSPESAVQKTAD